MFFFFQAEDGIRDDLVTGVQTCALPISCRRRLRHSRRALSRGRLDLRGGAAARTAGQVDRGPLRAPGGGEPVAKIGRASCRERVEISVGAVSLKKKKSEVKRVTYDHTK